MYCQAVLSAHAPQISNAFGWYAKMRLDGEALIMSRDGKEPSIEKGDIDNTLLGSSIQRCLEGDAQAMEALYEQYKRPLFSLVYRHTYNHEIAEDLLQDIFLKIFTHLQELQTEETFSGWAYRIALNTCYSYLRSHKKQIQKTIPLNDVERTIKSEDHTPERVMKKPLDEAIKSLPKKMKSVFLLHDVQGFKHKEIARMLGCSVGTSKSQLFKARMRIRQYLRDKQAL